MGEGTGRANWRRRGLLLAGGAAVLAWVQGVPHLAALRAPALQSALIPGLEPFRRLTGAGPATTGSALLAGLDAPERRSAGAGALERAVRADPWAALFDGRPRGAGPVPVAMFSDFNCPICRVMDARLEELERADPGSMRLVRHELPILGRGSMVASRAVLAADRQGAYAAMHARLARTPAVTDAAYVEAVAGDLGLDRDRLLRDMGSPAIEARLRSSRAVADVFGFFGTPAFAVGHLVFMGSLPTATLASLIAAERVA